jgi:hypothetical protein
VFGSVNVAFSYASQTLTVSLQWRSSGQTVKKHGKQSVSARVHRLIVAQQIHGVREADTVCRPTAMDRPPCSSVPECVVRRPENLPLGLELEANAECLRFVEDRLPASRQYIATLQEGPV